MSYLPQTPPAGGYLPYWLLLTAAASIYNSAQNYVVLWQTREIYAPKAHEITPLAARLFAAWSFTSATIRAAAAYNITDRTLYHLTMLAYLIVGTHYTLELLVFRTVRLNRASASVAFFAIIGMMWTSSQRSYYLG
ncbi:MAG: ergosterol biosynthesis protein [Tremellales sp. Tagirdzhanova-0007]|nr:MAG: ergosterol biosynthesis protein [Tremellales sp. Tagirdzhanova-0007]